MGLGNIFTPAKLLEGIGKGLDKMVDGQGDKAKRFSELLKLYEPFKLAQRYLAFMFAGVYLLSHLAAITVLYWDKELAELIWNHTNDNLLYIILTIVAFYFSGGVINGALKRLSKK
ncbi:MAG: hypothetical protein COA36_16915 [Desulfotalea sp.]|nr:MAG: hypothetical protein COA36_16915 [Desulfotalea sp.]